MTGVQRMVVRGTGPVAVQPARAGAPEQARTARPLPDGVRARMEAAFGAGFSDVSVREDGEVGSLEAVALTLGSQIAFDPGMYDPSSPEGLEMLGHELAHVLQQREGRVDGSGLVEDSALEAEADEAGRRTAHGQPVGDRSAPVGSAPAAGAEAAVGVAQPMRRSRSRSPSPRRSSLDPDNDSPSAPGGQGQQFAIGEGGDVIEYEAAPGYVDEGYGEAEEYAEPAEQPPFEFAFPEFEEEFANVPPDFDPEFANAPPSVVKKQRKARRAGLVLGAGGGFRPAVPARGGRPRRNFLAGHRGKK